jgi:hypothetical protein
MNIMVKRRLGDFRIKKTFPVTLQSGFFSRYIPAWYSLFIVRLPDLHYPPNNEKNAGIEMFCHYVQYPFIIISGVQVQKPASQVSFPEQKAPQAPQLLVSFIRNTQSLPHTV